MKKIKHILFVLFLPLILISVGWTTPTGWGVGVPNQLGDATPWLDPLGIPPWQNWLAEPIDEIQSSRFTPMEWRISSSSSTYQHLVKESVGYPDTIFFFGNEPEVSSQSNTPPAVAAAAMRQWKIDSYNHPFACCGVNWQGYGSPGQIWLDQYLAAGGPTPDVWLIHIYVPDPQNWLSYLYDFRTWDYWHPPQRRIVVNETCQFGGSIAMEKQIMDQASYAMQRPRIFGTYAVYWYSAHDPFGHTECDLLDANHNLTQIGQYWISLQ